jgi:hypothetical protein
MSDILIASHPTLLEAWSKISSCRSCNPKADIEFGLLLNYVRDLDPRQTLFCQTESVPCPNCKNPIWEGTLVTLGDHPLF